ncbi:MAG: ribonuclease HI family protein [Patescibacteria group bacterium]|nr:ribonuclease HI family protein [Patescibacteria group bacterium]
MQSITIYTDGGARGNPGPAGSGAVVYDGDTKVAEISEYLGIRTNNFAEYTALVLALERCVALFGARIERPVEVRMDSELIVKQMKGEYKVKHPVLRDRHLAVRRLIEESFPHISFTHVRREQNKEADKLANDAMDNGS